MLVCGCLTLTAWICRLPRFSMDHNSAGWILSLLRSCIYIGLFAFWGLSVKFRMIQTQARRFLISIAVLMVFWMVMRTLKYQFASSPDTQRFLWYCFYFPQIYIPLMALFGALSLGRPEDYPLPSCTALLHIPAFLLLMLVLTNDLHQQVFSFPYGDHMMRNGQYQHEAGYFLILCWIGICIIAVLCLLVSRSRIPDSWQRLWQPLLPIAAMVVYGMLYLFNFGPLLHYFGDMNVVVCLLVTLTFENCFQCGLIQTNSYYAELFEQLAMPAAVLKKNLEPVYISRNMPVLQEEQVEAAGYQAVEIGQDRLLHRHPLEYGYMLWAEDVSEIRTLQKQLAERAARLQEENDLLEAEITLKEKQAVTEVRSALYERASRELSAQFEQMNRMLASAKSEERRREVLPAICVLGAYVKRRCNMMIIHAEHEQASVDLLYHALRESADYLEQCGVFCLVRVNTSILMNLEALILAYDLFEMTAELCLERLETLMVMVDVLDHQMVVKIQAETEANLPDFSLLDSRIAAAGGVLEAEKEDGLLSLQLKLRVRGS